MPLLDESANGVFIIAATPFSDNGALDLASVDRMVDFYLERGVNGGADVRAFEVGAHAERFDASALRKRAN